MGRCMSLCGLGRDARVKGGRVMGEERWQLGMDVHEREIGRFGMHRAGSQVERCRCGLEREAKGGEKSRVCVDVR